MAQFEGEKNLNRETSELEVKGKFKLSEEELDTVAGGDVDSLEGVFAGDLGADFWFEDHFYKYTGMEATDSQGRRCIIYVAEDGSGFILLPKK